MRAQQYELRGQETFCMIAAQQVFAAQADQVRQLFGAEVQELSTEYRRAHELIRFYQKKLKK